MKKILIPTDFSAYAKHALDFAYQIAKKQHAALMLLNVIEYPTESTFNAMGVSNVGGGHERDGSIIAMMEKVKDKMKEIVTDTKYEGIDISYQIDVGNPFHTIAKEIINHQADLVVMGTHGISGVGEFLIGSNTERVVRHAHCPVISLRDKLELQTIKDIVFATDLNPDKNDKAIASLKELQQMLDAKVHIVRVNTPNNFITNRHAESLVSAFTEKYQLENHTFRLYNELIEEEGIIHFAEDIKAGLIAITTHGRKGIMHLLSGSITEDVVNHSKLPVWSYSIKRK